MKSWSVITRAPQPVLGAEQEMNTTKITLRSLRTNQPVELEFFPIFFQGEDYFGLDIGGELIAIYYDLPSEHRDPDVLPDEALNYLFVHNGDYYEEIARETTNRVLIIANDENQKPVMLDDDAGEFLGVRSGDTFLADNGNQYIATPFGWGVDTPAIRETIHTFGKRLSYASPSQ